MAKSLLKPTIGRYIVASLFMLATMVLVELGYTVLPFFTLAITAGIAHSMLKDLL
jgi:hypothetical protein